MAKKKKPPPPKLLLKSPPKRLKSRPKRLPTLATLPVKPLLLLAKLLTLLAKLQLLLAKLPALRLTLLSRLRLPLPPSNSGSRNAKPAFGPVFFRLQFPGSVCSGYESVEACHRFDQARKRLGVGDAQVALRLMRAKIDARRERHAGLFQQVLRKAKAVVGVRAAIGI